ncbi:PEP/pyruvate-binding domain-containing protein [Ramlibacter sp.]|uniref:PEP/pyruvate-binding domain-containing protein n=1 Tax=Ramlibacter sp. TaxID=1917967 RepID=UPI0035ADB21B
MSRPARPWTIGCGTNEGPPPPAQAIGGKAHNLARMAALGLPVPPAFVLGTDWCGRGDTLTPAEWAEPLRALESACGLRVGDARRPLLLSVRSGAPVSMPGMMETLLNIGLCDVTVPGLLRLTGDPRLVWDSYRRLVSGYGEVVLGVPAAAFEADLAAIAGGVAERALDFAQLRALTRRHQETLAHAGTPFPQDPGEQLAGAIRAVFDSWQSARAVAYRRLRDLPDAMGTAVTVQRMVFGNAGGMSGAGVGFTRHPSTGEPVPWVDFLLHAQGEDVVSGRRTAHGHDELAVRAPAVWAALRDALGRLEHEFRDMQDFEFTVQAGKLYLLQTRNGKRTPLAHARITLDLLREGLLSREEARARTRELRAEDLQRHRVAASDGAQANLLARATSACTGVASGSIALDEAAAKRAHDAGRPAILVRETAETADIAALDHAAGLLTARGARTSHAAVVARQLGKVCLVGCPGLEIDMARQRVRLGGRELLADDVITLDGDEGGVYLGLVQSVVETEQDLLNGLLALRAGPP